MILKLNVSLYSQQDKWNPHARPHLKRVKRGVVTEGGQPGKTGIFISFIILIYYFNLLRIFITSVLLN